MKLYTNTKRLLYLIAVMLIISRFILPLNTYSLDTSPQPQGFYSTESPDTYFDITYIDKTNLSPSDNIYIKFSEEINLNTDGNFTSLKEGTTLYKLPGANDKATDTHGNEYTREIAYTLINGSYRAEADKEEISIEDVQIINSDTLMIDPSKNLLNANSYQIVIDKNLLADDEGNSLIEDANHTLWTEKSFDENVPKWTEVKISSVAGKIDDVNVDQTIFTFNESDFENISSPGLSNPIVLYSDLELIPSRVSQVVYAEESKLYEDALKNISLKSEIHNVNITRIAFEYYYEDEIKKTKIHIYPEEALRYGEDYYLNIPREDSSLNVFETRGGQIPKDITVNLYINNSSEPQIKSTYPSWNEGKVWYDEKNLKHDVNHSFVSDYFFIKVTFYDENQSLDINDIDLLKNIQVNPEGTDSNFLDSNFISRVENIEDRDERYQIIDELLYTKDGETATLYIPVKPLLSGTKYNVSLPPGTLFFPGDSQGNSTKTWSFMTSTEPIVSDVMIASISENYDEDQPIYIRGDFFYEDNISVYIAGKRAERVYVEELKVLENGREVTKKYLEVYLPEGSNRLKPGIHNIEVRNDSNHTTEVYGAISVVEGGKHAPSEEYKVKKDVREGEVRGDNHLSEDTFILNNRYADDNYLKINLDELMGEEVLVKKIEYDGRKRDTLGILETTSVWGNISIFQLTIGSKDKEDISLRLGRVDPNVKTMLNNKLWGIKAKSEFIQITGENYSFSKVVLSIPYKNSSGRNLKVLRYDEDTRSFYNEKFSIDLVENRVRVDSSSKGIFIIVED